MKRTRTLIIAAVVLVLLIGIIVAEKLITRHVDDLNTTDEIIITEDADALTEVSWTTSDSEGLDFVKTDGTWADPDDSSFPVDQDAMAEFLANFEEVHASFAIDDIEDYSQYGLDNPTCTINLVQDDSATTIKLGGYSTMDSKRYVSVGDDRVYLIDDDLMDCITTERDDFMANDSVPDYATLDEVKVSGQNTLDVIVDTDGVYSYTTDYSIYDISTGEHRALDNDLVYSLQNTLLDLSPTDYATYTASDEDLSQYGLDDPITTIDLIGTVDNSEKQDGSDTQDASITLYVGAIITENPDAENKDDQETVDAYLRFGDSSIIYHLDEDTYDELTNASYNTLRPTEVLSLDWSQVTSVSVTIDGSTYDVTFSPNDGKSDSDTSDSSSEEESDTIYTLNDQQVDLSDFIAAANALSIDTFLDEQPDKTAEISVTINLDNADYPSISFTLYQYDGESCLTVFNGETLGLLSRDQMVDLKEAMNSVVLGLN